MPTARIDLVQQPKGDDIPGMLVVAVPLPNVPPVAVVLDPAQDEDDGRLSVGAGSIGLMPVPPSSVAPSGMVPIPSVDPAVVAEERDELCVPDTVPLELHDPDAPARPPPSKVEVDPPALVLPVTDIPVVPQSAVPPIEPSGPGLNPPG
jgi:hypothetical protein